MTSTPEILRPRIAGEKKAATLPRLKWELVHAEPGHLVFAMPGLMPAAHPRVRGGAGRSGGWAPSGSPTEHQPPATSNEHHALEYARYIGRIGVLAAALGVGAALAGQQPAIASAEPADSDSSTSTSTTATDTGATSPDRFASDETTPSGSADDTTSETSESAADAETSETEPETDIADAETDVAPPTSPESTPEVDEQSESPVANPESTEATAPIDAVPAPVVDGGAPTAETQTALPVENTPPQVVVPDRGEPRPATRHEISSEAPEVEETTTNGLTTAPSPSMQAPEKLTAEPAEPLGTPLTPRDAITATTPAAPAPVGIVSRFVETVLAPLNPSATTPAAAEAAQAPVVWGLFAWIRRSFFNSTPTLALDPTQTTQVDDTISGRLVVTDADGDPVNFTASAPVNGGTVVVRPDGTFTYTAPTTLYRTGGSDTFTVTATDAGTYPHMHGMSGFLNAITFGWLGDDGHDVSTTVTVTVNAAPIAAVPAFTLGAVDHTTGAVPGILRVTDPDQNTLRYTVTGGPADGSVVLDAGTGTFTYTPTPIARHEASAENATPDQLADDFAVTVDDSHGGVITVPVSVTIDPTNVAPAMTLTVSDPNSDGSVDVLVTVNDPDTDPVTYLVIHDPAYGQLTRTSSGYLYTPTDQARHAAAATPGQDYDQFTVEAHDAHHGVDTETVSVELAPSNAAPVAIGDTYTTAEDSPVSGNVLTNDTDADHDSLAAALHTPPTHGTVAIDTDGSFTYTPAAEYTGDDSFTYVATDGHGGAGIGAVSITVTPVNDAPVAVDDTVTTSEDTAVSGNVLANDIDVDNPTLTVASHTDPAHGTLSIANDGSFTYTPSQNWSGTDAFTYTATDGALTSNTATVSIAVTPVNDAPTATDDTYTTDEDTPVSGNVLANDTDVEAATLTVASHTDPAHGTLSIDTDGSFTYTPTENWSGADSFTYTASDGVRSSTPATVTVTVTPVNDAPVAHSDTYTTDEDTPLTIPAPGLLTNDTDVEGASLIVADWTPAAHGGVVVYADRSFTYTPAADYHGEDSFTYYVTDGTDSSSPATVTITVNPVNDAPRTADDSYSTAEDTPVIVPAPGVLANDTDVENEPLTVTAFTQPAHGAVVVNPDGSFTYTPTPDFNGEDSFTYTASDTQGAEGTATVAVTITPVNDAPVVEATVGAPNGSTGSVTVSLTASDPDGDPISVTTTRPARGTLSVNPDGTYSYTPTAAARLNAGNTPSADTDAFTVTVTDAAGANTQVAVGVPIAPADPAVTAIITVGTDPRGVAVSPDGTRAYVTDAGANTVSVIDTATNTTIKTIYVSGNPSTVALTPDGATAYVTQWAGGTARNTVAVIDTATNTVVKTIVVGRNPAAVVVDPSGNVAYVTNYASDGGTPSVSVIDTDTNTVATTITLNGNPAGVAVSPDGGRLYVANTGSRNSVTVIDTAHNTVITTIVVAPNAGSVAVSPDGTRAYVSSATTNSVAVIDTATNTVIRTVPVGSSPSTIVFSADGTLAYVANTGSNTVSMIDTATNTVIETVPVGSNAFGLAMSPTGTAYLDNVVNGRGSTTVISLVASAPTASTTVSAPNSAGVVTVTLSARDPEGDPLTVTNTDPAKGSVEVVDNADGTWDYTYTPTDTARHESAVVGAPPAAKQDTFTITVTDALGGAAVLPVLVAISPLNIAPVGGRSNSSDPDPSTGKVTGTVTGVTDADGDSLTYTGPGTSAKGGTVTVQSGGSFTYVPTDEARHAAAAENASSADRSDSFTVTASDGHGGSVNVEVTVTVAPANAAPTATVGTLITDHVSGIVTGTIAAADTDDDELTYTVTGFAVGGAVTVNPDGTFNYDPSDAARLHAGLTPDTETDSFTVTVNDGHGGTTPITVGNVPVSPVVATVTATISVANDPNFVAFTPDGNYAYTANYQGGTVSVIDTNPTHLTYNTVVATIPVGQSVGAQVAISPDGSRAYVANFNSNTVSVIDTATNALVDTNPTMAGTQSISVGTHPYGVAVSPDGSLAYIANNASGTVSVIDTDTNTVAATIPVGANPYGVAVADTPVGTRAYVANNASGTVSVIDTAANTVINTIPVGTSPFGVAVSPDGASAYVTSLSGGTLSVIDTATNTITATIPVGGSPFGVAVSPDGSLAYVTNNGSGTVSVIDTATNTVIQSIPANSYPFGVAVSPDGGRLCVAYNNARNTVRVISLVPSQNSAPVAGVPGYTVTGTNPTTGAVTGNLHVTDPDHDTLSYIAPVTTAKGGAVIVAASGSFIYTPTPEARHAASADSAGAGDRQDSFSVTVKDGRGGTVAVPVTVTISPTNEEPTSAPIVGPVNSTTGVVNGSLNAGDLDNDTLTYTVTGAPMRGAVAITPGGTFSYDPTDAARLQAGLTPEADTDSFTVTITDAHGGSTDVTVAGVPVTPAEATVTATVPLPGGSAPIGIAVTPDGTRAYVANYGAGVSPSVLSVIDTETNTPVATVDVRDPASAVAVSPDGRLLYATIAWGGSRVAVIDIDTTSDTYNTVIATIPVASDSWGLAFSPDGSRAYVTNMGSNSMTIIDTRTNTVIQTVPVGGAGSQPMGVSISPDGTRAYVANSNKGSVSIIDTSSNTLVDTVSVGSSPTHVTFGRDGTLAYVTNTGSNTVSVITSATNTVLSTLYVGDAPGGIAVSPDGSLAYVTNNGSGTVSVIDTATNTVIGTLQGLNAPRAVAVSPDGTSYAPGGDSVSVISLVTVNSAPEAADPAYTIAGVNPTTAQVGGTLNVTDPDNDVLSYSAPATTGKGGTVMVMPNGFFTYTPTAAIRHAAADENVSAADKNDTFTVTVSDGRGGTTTVPVTVAISPANTAPAPTSPPTVGNPTPSGIVSGSLKVADADSDPLTYSVTGAPARGLVTVDRNTGIYTYTPFDAARLHADTTPGPDTDTFTVTVADGHGGSTQVTVTSVPVSAAEVTLEATVAVGPQPAGVAVSPNGTRTYIADNGSNAVSIVDTATNTALKSVLVGSNPYGVAVSPDGALLYVTNQGSNSLSVINTATNTVADTITVGTSPRGVVISPDGAHAYVANQGSNSLSVINTATRTIDSTITSIGAMPWGVAVSPDGSRVYVANRASGSVSVIDTATNTTIKTIGTGGNAYAVAVSPSGSRAYVTNSIGNTVAIIDTTANAVVGNITVGSQPYGVAFSPDGSLVYVANRGSSSVSVIDTAAGTVVATVSAITGPYGIAAGPDGTAYVTNNSSNAVSVISLNAAPVATTTVGTADPATGEVHVTVSASDPEGAPLSVTNPAPSRGHVDVVDNGNGTWTYTYTPTDGARVLAGLTPETETDTFTVTVTDASGVTTAVPVAPIPIAPATPALTATVSVMGAPNQVVVSSDGTRAYVSNSGSSSVSVIDTTTDTRISTIATGSSPHGLALSPNGTRLYVASQGNDTVSVIDTVSNTVVTNVAVTGTPYGVTVSPDGTRAYVTRINASSIAVIDTSTNTLVTYISVSGAYPIAVTVSPDGSRAYVANEGSNTVSVINTATNAEIKVISVGVGPRAVAVTPDGTRVYVANDAHGGANGTVSVIDTATNAVTATIPISGSLRGVAIAPDGSLAYATSSTGTVSFIDLDATSPTYNTVIASVPVGNPDGVVVGPDGDAYVANWASNKVTTISLVPVA